MSPHAAPEQLVCGRYLVEKVLGEGTQGKTYLAVDTGAAEGRKLVALKVLHQPPAGPARENFVRTLERLQRLPAHPHTLQLVAFEEAVQWPKQDGTAAVRSMATPTRAVRSLHLSLCTRSYGTGCGRARNGSCGRGRAV